MLFSAPCAVRRDTGNDAVLLTWRLHGTLPYLAKRTMSGLEGQAFFALDRALNTAASGPKWLQSAAIAQSVVTALRFGEQQLDLYNLLAYCVMPNHVHLVLEPLADLSRINRTIKDLTTRNANQILGRPGQRFWDDESYERWIADPAERDGIVEYTEFNPVAAGLSHAPGEWPWSSASHALNAQLLVAP